MCPEHWYALPEDIRAAINDTYRPGQNALTASPAYRAALRDALDYARHHAAPGQLADPGPVTPSPWGHPEPHPTEDPDEPANRDIEPEPTDWHDGPGYDPEAAEHDQAPEPRS